MMAITGFPINTVAATAANVTNVPSGFLTATTVQAAIDELQNKFTVFPVTMGYGEFDVGAHILSIGDGNDATPADTDIPAVFIHRTSSGSNTPYNSALFVSQVEGPASTAQANAINIFMQNYGTNDCVALAAGAENFATNSHKAAFGLFASARATGPGTSAISFESGGGNFTGVAHPYFPNLVASATDVTIALDIDWGGTSLGTAHMVLRGGPVDVGIGFQSNCSVATALFVEDDTTAPTVLLSRGTHATGLDFSGATISGFVFKSVAINIKSAALTNAANDGAAASAGVAVGQMYRNGSVLMIRVS